MATLKLPGLLAGTTYTVHYMGTEVYLAAGAGPVSVFIPDLGKDFELYPAKGRRWPGQPPFTYVQITPQVAGDYVIEIDDGEVIDNRGAQVITDIEPHKSAHTWHFPHSHGEGDGGGILGDERFWITLPENPARRSIEIGMLDLGGEVVGVEQSMLVSVSGEVCCLLFPFQKFEQKYSGEISIGFVANTVAIVTEYFNTSPAVPSAWVEPI